MVSMPEHVKNALQRFYHLRPHTHQDQLHPHFPPKYGSKQQYAEQDDTLPTLNRKDKKIVQEVVGNFLHYAHAVDYTMLAALGSIATKQMNPTKNAMKKVKQHLTMRELTPMQSSHTKQD